MFTRNVRCKNLLWSLSRNHGEQHLGRENISGGVKFKHCKSYRQTQHCKSLKPTQSGNRNIGGPWWTNCSTCSVGMLIGVRQTRGGFWWGDMAGIVRKQIESDLNEEVFIWENWRPAGVSIVNSPTVLYARTNLKIKQNCKVSANKITL